MANLHILSPWYREGAEISRCMVGSIKTRISRNPGHPAWLFVGGLLHWMEQQEVARGLGKEWASLAPSLVILRQSISLSLKESPYDVFGVISSPCDVGWHSVNFHLCYLVSWVRSLWFWPHRTVTRPCNLAARCSEWPSSFTLIIF